MRKDKATMRNIMMLGATIAGLVLVSVLIAQYVT